MAGAQSLVALKAANGSMVIKTYNISSYTSLVEGKLDFDVTETMAEYFGGVMKLFATVSLPKKLGTMVNQVWQVGPSVMNGFPAKHDFGDANLAAKGTIDFLSRQSTGGTGGGRKMKKRNGTLIVHKCFCPPCRTRSKTARKEACPHKAKTQEEAFQNMAGTFGRPKVATVGSETEPKLQFGWDSIKSETPYQQRNSSDWHKYGKGISVNGYAQPRPR